MIRASLTNRQRPEVVLAAVACALALAACGSTGKPTAAGGSNGNGSFLKFSECMRSHGVPNFPDPSPGGGIHIAVGSGFNRLSPAFQSAQQACRHLLPGGSPPTHVPENVKLRALKQAQCMRAHGVPNYPDPTFPTGGAILVGPGPGSGVDPNSPAFQKAAKACGNQG